MADEKITSKDEAEVEAHSVLDMQETEDSDDEVEAHDCISVLSKAVA
jgi:hypothetical protein